MPAAEVTLDPRIVGANLRRLRRAARHTQVTLSEAAGVGQAFLSKAETGGTLMRLETAVRFVVALGCTLDDLIEGAVVDAGE